jgi:hypothetical protein
MFTINLSKDSDYCTQINNKLIPFQSCNTTSAIMALDAAGVRYPITAGEQPEDSFTRRLQQPDAWVRFREKYPWAVKAGLIPQNVSGMLAWGINQFVGRAVDYFTINGTLQKMCWILMQGRPLIMSGKFTDSGHFVAVVGFATKQNREEIQSATSIDLSRIVAIIVDDPYGNYYTRYQDHRGNNIHFELDVFHDLTNVSNADGNKWMHIIGEPV